MIHPIQSSSGQRIQHIQPSQPRNTSLFVANMKEVTKSDSINSIEKLKKWASDFEKATSKFKNAQGLNQMMSSLKNLVNVMHQLCPKAVLNDKAVKPSLEPINTMMNKISNNSKKLSSDIAKYTSNPKISLSKEVAEINNAILKNIMPASNKLFAFLNTPFP